MRRVVVGLLAAGVSALLLAPAAAAAVASELPKGFLKYEIKQARKPFGTAEISWRVTDEPADLALLAFCDGKHTSLFTKAESLRSVFAEGDAEYRYSEQVAVFKDEKGAAGMLAALRKAVKGCAKVKVPGGTVAYRGGSLSIGDEALQVSRYNLKPKTTYGERSVVVRKGSAVIVYAEAGLYSSAKPKRGDFTKQVNDAKAMTVKVCDLPGVC